MVYFQVIGPDENLNTQFIEKMANKRFVQLNDYRSTTDRKFDHEAEANYFIMPDNIEMDHSEKQAWMEYYFNNSSMVWVKEF